jgi:hypothetical protein
MEFGKAFGFVFQDEDWIKKLGIGSVLLLVPVIGNLAVLGWGTEVTRRVIEAEEEELPAWSDFGGLIKKGFMTSVIGLVYFLPIILFQGCAQGMIFAAPEIFSGQDAETAMLVALICMGCLSLLYALFAGLVLPSAIASYAVSGSMKEAFQFGAVLARVRAAPGAYALALVGAIIAVLVIAPLGIIACSIGVFVTLAYSFLITGHLNGQAYLAAGDLATAGMVEEA